MSISTGSTKQGVTTWWRGSQCYLITTCSMTGLTRCPGTFVTSPPVLETVTRNRKTITPPSFLSIMQSQRAETICNFLCTSNIKIPPKPLVLFHLPSSSFRSMLRVNDRHVVNSCEKLDLWSTSFLNENLNMYI